MDRRTREELKESLKWIRWKKYFKKVSIVDSRVEYRGNEFRIVVLLRDENRKIFKDVKIIRNLESGKITGETDLLTEYVNKRMGYSYIEGVK